jgi:hypothetical protein
MFVTFPFRSARDLINCGYLAQLGRAENLPNRKSGVAIHLQTPTNYSATPNTNSQHKHSASLREYMRTGLSAEKPSHLCLLHILLLGQPLWQKTREALFCQGRPGSGHLCIAPGVRPKHPD